MFTIKRGGGLGITVVIKAFVPKYPHRRFVNFPSQHVFRKDSFANLMIQNAYRMFQNVPE